VTLPQTVAYLQWEASLTVCVRFTNDVACSLAHSLAHSLTRALMIHSLAHSLTHSRTHDSKWGPTHRIMG
jgi:hypothetical protein